MRSLRMLKKKKLKIDTLVTDRHKQIAKWLKENAADIDHRYDIWHLAKCWWYGVTIVFCNYQTYFQQTALGKKIDKVAKEKECELVGKWKKSLINHLYWSATSTSDGNGDVIQAKWLSVNNHIHNKHRNHGKLFPVCEHKTLQGKRRKKKWFKHRKCPWLLSDFNNFVCHNYRHQS